MRSLGARRLWGVWFYTTNGASYDLPVPRPQTEEPIGSFEGHWSYDFKKARMWASLDGNFWWGGITALSGIRNPETKQTSSRIGGTFAYPFTKHQSVKIAYSYGPMFASAATTRTCRWLGSIPGLAGPRRSSIDCFRRLCRFGAPPRVMSEHRREAQENIRRSQKESGSPPVFQMEPSPPLAQLHGNVTESSLTIARFPKRQRRANAEYARNHSLITSPHWNRCTSDLLDARFLNQHPIW